MSIKYAVSCGPTTSGICLLIVELFADGQLMLKIVEVIKSQFTLIVIRLIVVPRSQAKTECCRELRGPDSVLHQLTQMDMLSCNFSHFHPSSQRDT